MIRHHQEKGHACENNRRDKSDDHVNQKRYLKTACVIDVVNE